MFDQIFKQSRWLTRGWTLQELLAPQLYQFYTMDWQLFNNQDTIKLIAEETAIPFEAITDFKPERWSAAQKMSWAAHRQTTRIEDRAYSLLGIFNVNMPLIYGEGGTAFRRLQEEILKNSTDQTIFCWTAPETGFSKWRGLLARSPSEFANSGDFLENKRLKTQPFQLTNKGIQIGLKLAPASSAPADFIAALQCCRDDSLNQCGVYIRRIHDDNYIRVVPNRVVKLSSSFVRNKATFFEMLFAKPELAGVTWQKSDMCPRIAGFCFLGIDDTLRDDRNIWVNDILPKDQFSWDRRTFFFGVDPDKKVPESAVSRCHLDSLLDCGIEIWVKYDWEKRYGENDDDDKGDSRGELR